MNNNLEELIQGLVVVVHSLPRGLQDGNGDDVEPCLMDGLVDLADALDLDGINFDAADDRPDTIQVDRTALKRVQGAANLLSITLEALPQTGGDRDE